MFFINIAVNLFSIESLRNEDGNVNEYATKQ